METFVTNHKLTCQWWAASSLLCHHPNDESDIESWPSKAQDVNVLQLQTSASSNKWAGSNGLGKGKGGKGKYTPPAATYRVIRWNIIMETSVDAGADDDDDYDD